MSTYEEKYKSALEWMRSIYPTMQGADKEDAEHHFPELRESEDEQHCKWILEYLYDGLRKSDEQFKDQFKSAIAWLEKQGEQKPIIIIPQFKVGDTIKPKSYNEEHLIKDINENGYVLDVDITIPFKDEDVWGIVAQNPTWSEEDEKTRKTIIEYLQLQDEMSSIKSSMFKDWISWIERQNTHEMGEEDIQMLEETLYFIGEYQKSNKCKDENDMQNSVTCENWLKSIKDRVQPQSTSEWSEEDEYQINTILHGLNLKRELYKKIENQVEEERYKTQYDWLKSIKPNHWKPSDEHFRALFYAIEYFKKKKNDTKYLESLYDGLKQL